MKSIIIAVALILSSFSVFASDVDSKDGFCKVNLQESFESAKAAEISQNQKMFGPSWSAYSSDFELAWDARTNQWIEYQKSVCK